MKRIMVYILPFLLLLAYSCKNKSEVVITRVYEGDNGRAIYFDTKEKVGNLLISNSQFIYGIMDKTENNTWIIVEQSPFSAGPGRVETELQLFNIPELRQVDPSYSLYGSCFEKKDGKDCLVIYPGDGTEEIIVPLADLLEKAKSVSPEKPETISEPEKEIRQETAEKSVSATELETVVQLKLGTGEVEIGLGKQPDDGKLIYSVPAFAVFENQIFVVDATNFRVLVFDYSGNFVRIISYPEKTEDGSANDVRDICVDKGVLYLSSSYANRYVVYVIDSDTEDIIEIITGSDTHNKKFESIDIITLDNLKNLLIPDTGDNSLYVYAKGEGGMKLIRTIPYTGRDQLAPDTEGNVFSINTDGNEVTVFDAQGNSLTGFTYNTPAGNSKIIDIDDNNVIYVQTFESQSPDSQFDEGSYIKVIQQDGTFLNEYPVPAWPGGGIAKYIVVDAQGTIFVAEYNFSGTESQDDPPTGFLIRRLD